MNFVLANQLPDQLSNIFIPVYQKYNKEVLEKFLLQYQLPGETIAAQFSGEKGLHLNLISPQGTYIHLWGMGKENGFPQTLKQARSFLVKEKKLLGNSLGLVFFTNSLSNPALHWEALLNGLTLGTYSIGKYKSEPDPGHPLSQAGAKVYVLDDTTKDLTLPQILQQAQAIADSQKRIMDLVNAPANFKKPEQLAAWAQDSGKKYNYDVTVLDKSALEKEKFYALLAVNRGSEWPGRCLILNHEPSEQSNAPHVCLLGKGVTFDTGGISLKKPPNMHLMKSDMGGAAAVLGAMEVTAKLNLPIRLTVIVPITDNCIGSTAIKPGDVISSRSGKSIEIIDTDAEGRLILADSLAYACQVVKPDIMIDLATLTGSCVQTFGYEASGLFTKNDLLAERIHAVGELYGERTWRLPMWDAYKEDLKSDVADIRNFHGKATAGAISAAKFLEFFTEEHPNWAHLDIAGVALRSNEFGADRNATGYGVRLLTGLLQSLINRGL